MLKIQAMLTGEDELLKLLGEMPDRIQNRVFRHAGRKAATAVAKRAGELTPRNVGKRANPTKPHLADTFTQKQKVYRNTATTVNIVGAQTGEKGHNRINHLVEDGTEQRFTNSRSRYKTVDRGMVTRLRKVRTASGGYRTIKVHEMSRKLKSIGSFAKGTNQRASESTGKNRGKMPAFKQLERAVAETNVSQIYEMELRAGLQRIADRQSS